MRYRALTSDGDFTFGAGPGEYLVNSPACVAQAVLTALLLHQQEWFLDLDAGMPWETQVLGYGTQSLYDAAIKAAILGVQGVQAIISYSSSLDVAKRILTVTVVISTIFGNVTLNENFNAAGYGISPFGQVPFGGA